MPCGGSLPTTANNLSFKRIEKHCITRGQYVTDGQMDLRAGQARSQDSIDDEERGLPIRECNEEAIDAINTGAFVAVAFQIPTEFPLESNSDYFTRSAKNSTSLKMELTLHPWCTATNVSHTCPGTGRNQYWKEKEASIGVSRL